ncbi:MAG: PilZ domain-containing protein [Thermodesulfobacteriota bacterium]
MSVESGGASAPRLSPGHPISITAASDDRNFRASMLGVKPGEFLIVKPPLAMSAAGRAQGSQLLVRLEENGVIYGFEASVLFDLKLPAHVLFLSYPRSFEVHALRRHPRFKCLIPTVVESGQAVCPGHLSDISLGGCRVVAKASDARAVHTEFGESLDVCLPVDGLRIEKLHGMIRRREEGKGILSLGLCFAETACAAPVVARFLERLRRAEDLREPAKAAPAPNAAIRPSGLDLRDATASVEDARQVELKCLEPLDIQFTGSHMFERSTILGVDGTEMVIAEMPVGSGLRNCPKPGMGLRARFEANGSYYGFMTSVAKFITKPRPMVLFGYPKKIEVLMRRKHPRVTCLLPAKVENDHCDASGYITDISLGGCRVLANLDDGEPIVNIMTGDRMDVSLPLDGLRIERIRARVSSLSFEGAAVALGLVFALDKRQNAKLGRFLGRLEEAAG